MRRQHISSSRSPSSCSSNSRRDDHWAPRYYRSGEFRDRERDGGSRSQYGAERTRRRSPDAPGNRRDRAFEVARWYRASNEKRRSNEDYDRILRTRRSSEVEKHKDGKLSPKEKDGNLVSKEKDGALSSKEKDGNLVSKEKDGALSSKEEDRNLVSKEIDGKLESKEEVGNLFSKEIEIVREIVKSEQVDQSLESNKRTLEAMEELEACLKSESSKGGESEEIQEARNEEQRQNFACKLRTQHVHSKAQNSNFQSPLQSNHHFSEIKRQELQQEIQNLRQELSEEKEKHRVLEKEHLELMKKYIDVLEDKNRNSVVSPKEDLADYKKRIALTDVVSVRAQNEVLTADGNESPPLGSIFKNQNVAHASSKRRKTSKNLESSSNNIGSTIDHDEIPPPPLILVSPQLRKESLLRPKSFQWMFELITEKSTVRSPVLQAHSNSRGNSSIIAYNPFSETRDEHWFKARMDGFSPTEMSRLSSISLFISQTGKISFKLYASAGNQWVVVHGFTAISTNIVKYEERPTLYLYPSHRTRKGTSNRDNSVDSGIRASSVYLGWKNSSLTEKNSITLKFVEIILYSQ